LVRRRQEGGRKVAGRWQGGGREVTEGSGRKVAGRWQEGGREVAEGSGRKVAGRCPPGARVRPAGAATARAAGGATAAPPPFRPAAEGTTPLVPARPVVLLQWGVKLVAVVQQVMHVRCLEAAWKLHGICLEAAWKLPGIWGMRTTAHAIGRHGRLAWGGMQLRHGRKPCTALHCTLHSSPTTHQPLHPSHVNRARSFPWFKPRPGHCITQTRPLYIWPPPAKVAPYVSQSRTWHGKGNFEPTGWAHTAPLDLIPAPKV
jgi:hypothetical protein